ncbi:thiolase family protein [Agromyces bauzanensis]
MTAPVLVAARRTPIGTAGRGFARHTVDALAAPVLAAVAEAVAPAGLGIDDVVLGNCMGPGGDVARVAALRAGLGTHVPGVTVDRQCGSGLDAVMQAASRVRAGDAALVIAGGAESASTAPHRHWPDSGARYPRAPFAPAGFPDPDMGPAADRLATLRGISRARQDAWAARSHARAIAAQAAGVFDAELVAVDGVARDDRPRAAMDLGRLARFRPAFAEADDPVAGRGRHRDGGQLVRILRRGRGDGRDERADRPLAGPSRAARARRGGGRG